MTKLLVHSNDAIGNDSRIYHYIYEQRAASRAAIAHHLRLSLPTVTQHLTAMLESGMIEKGDLCDSTGGRKAQAYSFNPLFHRAAGVDIWQDSYELIVLDLYGKVLLERSVPFAFSNSDEFYPSFSASLLSELEKEKMNPASILGLGISVQGIITPDREQVAYGDAMNTVGLQRARFAEHFPFPCLLIHNVDAAAYAESWYHENLTNAFYLSLCDYFGASLIIDGLPYQGEMATGSTIEHMCLIPDGQTCYCGKRGCVEAYCSEKALVNQAGEPEELFFEHLRKGNIRETGIWTNYLKKLALVIDNIRMVIHSQVIIGGTLAGFLTDTDLRLLEKLVQEVSSFRTPGHFISLGLCGRSSAAKGAALQHVISYLNQM